VQAMANVGDSEFTDLAGVVLRDGQYVLSGAWTVGADGVQAAQGATSGLINLHVRLR
jgi:hypothetical protein